MPLVRKEVEDLAAWLLSTPSKEGSAQTREMGVKLSAEPIDEEFLSGNFRGLVVKWQDPSLSLSLSPFR